MRIEELLTTCRGRQASSSSQQESSESSKVSRITLETWTAEEELGAGAEEQLGAEEETLERKGPFEAMRPKMLEVGEVLAEPVLDDLTLRRATEAASVARGTEGNHRDAAIPPWQRRSASGASGWTTTPLAEPR